ncbi:MAG: helix-turn-helix domain-containing protein [Firmicutes bacterium]|nr:helix-turn-helix domain-containing protein [Bacillota bacterium]
MAKPNGVTGNVRQSPSFDDLWHIMESGQTQNLLDLATRMACELTNSDSSLILLKSPDGQYSRYASVYRAPKELLNYVVNMSESIGNYTMLKAHPVLIDDYSSHPRKVPLLDGFGYKQVLSVPIVWRDTTFGALNVHSLQDRAYGSVHIEYLTRISRIVSVGLYHSKVDEFTAVSHRMLDSLTELDRLADRSQNIDEVARDISYLVNNIFPGKSIICWQHPGSGTVEIADSSVLGQHHAEALENIVRTALKSGASVHQPLTMQFSQGDLPSLVTLFPLTSAHLSLGALCVFSENELSALQTEYAQLFASRVGHLLGHVLLPESISGDQPQIARTTDVQRMVDVVADLGQVAPLQRPQAIARRLQEYFGADAAALYLWDRTMQPEGLMRVAVSARTGELPSQLFIYEPIWRDLIMSNRPIAIAHLNNPRAHSSWTPLQMAGLHSLLAQSVTVQGQTFLLILGWSLPMGFTSREKSLLNTFLSIGRVLLAEYCRESYYQEQFEQTHEQLMRLSGQLSDQRLRLRYLSDLAHALDQPDPLAAALAVIQQFTQRAPRLEDGLGHVLYGIDRLDFYYGIHLDDDAWARLAPREPLLWENTFMVLLDGVPGAPVLLVVPDGKDLMTGPLRELLTHSLPIVSEALKRSLSLRQHLQHNRTDLLLSLSGDTAESLSRLKIHSLGIREAEYYRLGILGSARLDDPGMLLDLLDDLNGHDPEIACFLYKSHLLILFPIARQGKCPGIDRVLEYLRHHALFSSLALSLGVSTPFRTFDHLTSRIEEAEKAWQSAVAQRAPSLYYDDLNIFHLVTNPANVGAIAAFIQRTLAPLMDYDREHDANLVLTLKQYLECGGVLQTTADALFLHVNSLKYRLRKIASLLNTSLDDPAVRLNLQMCFRFMEVIEGHDSEPRAQA